MKKILLVISVIVGLCLTGNTTKAQAPSWTWSKQVGDTSIDTGSGIATDSIGNVYAIGYFKSNSVVIGTNTVTNAGPAGSYDSYIVKYDASGNVVWSKEIGGTGDDFSTATATDKSGNVYVTGGFSSSALNLGSITLTNTGYSDLFLAKYDTNGNLLWAKNANGPLDEWTWGLCVDASGSAYITGKFADSLTLGSYFLKHTGTMNSNNTFTAKFDSNGNVLWAKSAGGSGGSTIIAGDYATGISADGSSNTYVTVFSTSSTFTFGTTVLNYTAGMHALLLKYDANGNPIWIKNTGDLGDYALGAVTDASGNVYMIGTAYNTVFTVGTITLTTAGYGDMFIVKFDASGNVLWAQLAGGSSEDGASSVSMDGGGNIYVTGYFKSPAIAIGSTTLTRVGNKDAFVVKYDASGNVLWATNAYGNDVECKNVCVEPSGDVYITGQFNGSSATFGSTVLNNMGNYDAFIAKLSGSTSGIKESSLNNSAFIYPNPFATEAAIKLDKSVHDATVRVYNVNGQIVKEINGFNGADYILSRENLEAGMYFLHIISKNGTLASGKLTIIN